MDFMNQKKYFIFLTFYSLLLPIVSNSDLIEFNNQFCTPNNYKPYTGEALEYYKNSDIIFLEGNYHDGYKNGAFIYYYENDLLGIYNNTFL